MRFVNSVIEAFGGVENVQKVAVLLMRFLGFQQRTSSDMSGMCCRSPYEILKEHLSQPTKEVGILVAVLLMRF